MRMEIRFTILAVEVTLFGKLAIIIMYSYLNYERKFMRKIIQCIVANCPEMPKCPGQSIRDSPGL